MIRSIGMDTSSDSSSLSSASYDYEQVDHCYASWFFYALQEMKSDGDLMDVTLCAEGKEIRCHRLVLAACSDYFRTMFSGSLSESKKDKIEIGGVSADILQLLVDYAYTSKVTVTTDNIQPLFEAADMLQVLGAYGECEEFLQERMSVDTCLGIWVLTDKVSSTRLSERAKYFALKHFEEVSKTEEFLQLPKDLLKAYISDRGLLAKDEEQLLEVIMLWTRHDLEERKGHLKELLSFVSFSRIDQSYLKNILKKDDILAKVPGIKKMMKSKALHSTSRQILQQEILVLGGMHTMQYGFEANEMMYELDLDFQCSDSDLMPEPFCDSIGFAACVVDNDVIVTGGHNSLSQAWKYETSSSDEDEDMGTWTKLWSLRKGRCWHGMAVWQGQVYVVGGRSADDDSDRIPHVEVYNMETNRWRKAAPLPKAVCNFGITTCKEKIYVFGGEVELYNDTQALQVYDPSSNEWTLDTYLPVPMSSIAACTVNSKMYLVGGNLKSVLCFNPEEQKVKQLADRLADWDLCSATVCGSEIFITGGRSHGDDAMSMLGIGNSRPTVQYYNVNNGLMMKGNDLPVSLYGHCAVTVTITRG